MLCLHLPGGSAGKESACMRETLVQSPGWEDPLEKRKATVHGVAKSQTRQPHTHPLKEAESKHTHTHTHTHPTPTAAAAAAAAAAKSLQSCPTP